MVEIEEIIVVQNGSEMGKICKVKED